MVKGCRVIISARFWRARIGPDSLGRDAQLLVASAPILPTGRLSGRRSGASFVSSHAPTPAPHPLAEGIDWAAIEQEAAQTLSAYVKLDSSHPVGRTVDTAGLLADRLAAEGIPSKVYTTP